MQDSFIVFTLNNTDTNLCLSTFIEQRNNFLSINFKIFFCANFSITPHFYFKMFRAFQFVNCDFWQFLALNIMQSDANFIQKGLSPGVQLRPFLVQEQYLYVSCPCLSNQNNKGSLFLREFQMVPNNTELAGENLQIYAHLHLFMFCGGL